MKKIRSLFMYATIVLVGLVALAATGCYLLLQISAPQLNGEIKLAGLSASVEVASDSFGIPVITAGDRLDAVRALGYVTARDRLFQMDLMRRKSAGRLAELFGEAAIDNDIKARNYGFSRAAKAVTTRLSRHHKHLLDAYAEGVNAYIQQMKALPFEFSVLNYRPEPWQAEDSILVTLNMYETLTGWSEREERMLSVMAHTLSEDTVAFLTPDTDRFTDRLLNHAESLRPPRPIPVASLTTALAAAAYGHKQWAQTVQLGDAVAGSNAWVVAGTKTQDGRAILANDMHLGISVPNIWYRVELNYGNLHAAGVLLPGTPVLVAGSNSHLAWGATNLSGDFLDLVTLEINPDNPDEYRVNDGWQRFERFSEQIVVKNSVHREITVRQTIWGPVSREPLLSKPVAIHWTALDSEAVNIDLIDLEQSDNLEQAITVVNRTGGPQLNVLFADKQGRIAWTLMGSIPKRFGIDGSVSRSWADGAAGWDGYVDPEALPRQIDPPEGFLVSANDRRLGKQYPHVIGRQFAGGYRAYRITQLLKQLESVNERSMFDMQLDTESRFYDFYQQLALSVLPPKAIEQEPKLAELKSYLLAWNGKAEADSLGFALLVDFRKQLAETVFAPFLSACRQVDQSFKYSWTYIDTPLQVLLTEKIPQLMPDPANFRDWDSFILAQLTQSFHRLQARYPNTVVEALTWGKVNKAQYRHPFSMAMPLLGVALDMPEEELSGCSFCVRVTAPAFGASKRLVVSPAHIDEGILHMPGGQSGHPLSPYYRDQYGYWVEGLPLPLRSGESEHQLVLKP